MDRLRQLIHEIHRRSLWQVLGIYLVASWAVLQVVDTLGGALRLPDWTQPFALVLLIVGLPIVLATAFVQEGISGDDGGEEATESPRPVRTASLFTWRNALGGGVLAFAAWGVVAAGWVVVGGERGDVGGETGASAAADPSIAVLPFEDLSAAGDQRYFVEGLSEEIINALAQVPGLKVAARTSSFILAREAADITTIATTLGVAYVLEGSVRKSGDRVRITAQLIEAESGFHLWSETFDRTLDDIFEIQDAIARAIADDMALPLGIGSGERLVAAPTGELDAYDLYLRARTTFADRSTLDDVDAVIDFYEQALRVDPEYALAYAGVAEAWAVRPNYSGQWNSDLESAEAAARTALALDGSLTRARLVLANVHRDRWEWELAEEAYRVALDGLTDDPEVHQEYGEFLSDVGRCDEAVQEQRRALQADPLSRVFHYFLATALLCSGRPDEAIVEYRVQTELGFRAGRGPFVLALLETGQLDEAIAYARSQEGLEWYRAVAEAARDGGPPATAFNRPSGPFAEVWGLALIGDRDGAIETSRRVVAQARGPVYQLRTPSVARLLGEDPEFRALLERAGIPW